MATAYRTGALRLSLYTDFSIRLLMHLAVVPPAVRVSTRQVSSAFGVSQNHMQKAVLGLAKLGYVRTTTGRGGGLRLARPAAEIRVGQVVADVESTGEMMDCQRGPCPLAGRCMLRNLFDAAEQAFIEELDKWTIAEIVDAPTGTVLRELAAAGAGMTDLTGRPASRS